MRAARTNHLDICYAVLAAGVVSLCLRPAAARANPAEIFGFGSEHAAMAGVGTARADDFSAAYYNPAGLAFGAGKRLSLGALGFVSNLSIDDRRMPIAEPLGLTMGLSAPLPFGGDLAERVQIGVGVYLLPTIGARIIARLPDEPFFPYYDNRTQRAVLLPSLAVRLSERWSVGVAANALATLNGRVVAAQGPTRGLDARLDQEVPTLARFHLGARFRPRPSLDLGLSFRQAFSVPFSTIADVEVAGEPIDISIRASGLFTPTQVSGGLFWHPDGSAGALSADITWANWSAYPGPFVRVQSALPLVGPLAAELPRVPYRDTIGVRLGAEAAIGALALRGGYGFESSPIPAEQSGTTNLADGHKHIVSAGAGIAVPAVLAGLVGARSMRVDVHAQAQLVSERRYHKRLLGDGEVYDPFTSLRDEVTDDPSEPATQGAQISNPGYPDLRSGGQVMSAGVTVEVGF